MACQDNGNELMTAKLAGFMNFGNWLFGNRVLGINIQPSDNFELLRSEFVQRLEGFCQLSEFDTKKWKPHATLAFKDIDNKYSEIKRHLEKKNCPEIKNYIARITLMKNRRILIEYDFLQHRVLNRYEALNRENRRQTLALLKNRLASEGKT
jgi:2'-5' RNA ligase